MYLLLAGNDSVLISLWRGGGVRCTECPLVRLVIAGVTLSNNTDT